MLVVWMCFMLTRPTSFVYTFNRSTLGPTYLPSYLTNRDTNAPALGITPFLSFSFRTRKLSENHEVIDLFLQDSRRTCPLPALSANPMFSNIQAYIKALPTFTTTHR